MKTVISLILILVFASATAQKTTPFTSNFDDDTQQGWILYNTCTYSANLYITSSYYHSSSYSLFYDAFDCENTGIRMQNVQSPGTLSFWLYDYSYSRLQVFFDDVPYGPEIDLQSGNSWTNYSFQINNTGIGDLDFILIDSYGYLIIDDIEVTQHKISEPVKTYEKIPIKPWAIGLAIVAIAFFLVWSQRRRM